MNASFNLKNLATGIGKALFLLAVLITGAAGIFLSQAAARDYRDLFNTCLIFCIFHFVLAAVYFNKVRHWTRWIVVVFATVASFAIAEFGLRVFCGIRSL